MPTESGFRLKRVSVSTDLSPSDVRLCVLEQHAALRHRLVELQGLARDVALEPELIDELRACLRQLITEFSAHLDAEEAILVPVIEALDGGHERVARLRAEHALQRALLRRMFEQSIATPGPIELAIETDALVLRVFHDMMDEERELLTEELLADGAIDQRCG